MGRCRNHTDGPYQEENRNHSIMDDFTQRVLDFSVGPQGQTFAEYLRALFWSEEAFHLQVLAERSHKLKLGVQPTPENVGLSLAGDLAKILMDIKNAGARIPIDGVNSPHERPSST